MNFNYSFRSGAGVLKARGRDVPRRGDLLEHYVRQARHGTAHEAPKTQRPAPSICGNWKSPTTARTSRAGRAVRCQARDEPASEARPAHRTRHRRHDRPRQHSARRRAAPVSAGDILILVRRRGELFESVIQALKQAHVEVAGADRLKLTEHIAVIDLMALADALLLHRDDLSLAIALKSPLFGLDDDHLMTLAPGRTGTLRDALYAQRDVAPYDAAWARLEACERARARTRFRSTPGCSAARRDARASCAAWARSQRCAR